MPPKSHDKRSSSSNFGQTSQAKLPSTDETILHVQSKIVIPAGVAKLKSSDPLVKMKDLVGGETFKRMDVIFGSELKEGDVQVRYNGVCTCAARASRRVVFDE